MRSPGRNGGGSNPVELSPILSAALDAFYEKGFHGASVRDIARRVGVTVPALYYHYDSKEACWSRSSNWVPATSSPAPGPPTRRVTATPPVAARTNVVTAIVTGG